MAVQETKLLEGLAEKLGGAGISVRALARYTAQSGVLVSVRCGRIRGRMQMPSELLGVKTACWSMDTRRFSGAHISSGTLSVLPRESARLLTALDHHARRIVKENSINGSCSMGNYVPLTAYDRLRENFSGVREQYMSIVDAIAQDWDSIVGRFEDGLTQMVSEVGNAAFSRSEQDAMRNRILSGVPTAEQFQKSAYMELEVRIFPATVTQITGLSDTLRAETVRSWRDDVVSNAISSIQAALEDIFGRCCRTLTGYQKTGNLNTRSVAALMQTAEHVREMNVFSNPMLRSLADRLSALDDDAERIVECLLDIYAYTRDTGLTVDLTQCPFTESGMNAMLVLREREPVQRIQPYSDREDHV